MANELILAVDDEAHILELLSFNLEASGYRVVTAATGEDALVVCAHERPAMVLLDIMLPGADGFTICRTIRKQSGIPVIFITARGREEDILHGYALGCDDYIVKPFLLSAGHWEKSDVLDRCAKQLRAAGMAWRIAHARVGKVGGDFDGMGDFRVPDGTFGMEIVEYSPQAAPSEAEIQAELALDRDRFDWDEGMTEETLVRTLAASLKIRKWIAAERLDAFTIAFPGICRQNGWETVPFLECTKAMARGIGYAGEGDVLTAAFTRCVADVFPETSFTEMFCPDWKRDRIFTSHMGEINMAVCSAKLNLHEMKYKFSDTGNPAVATGCLQSGPAVLADLAPGPDGTFSLIAAKVAFEAPEGPSTKQNTGWFRPDRGSIADFLAAYSRAGGTHHLACAFHADTAVFRDWAELMKWKFVEL